MSTSTSTSTRPIVAVIAAVIVAALLFGIGSPAAQAQPTGNYVPLQPCPFVTSSISATATVYYLARGACNVPSAAVGVAVVATVTDPIGGAGILTVWESSLPRPNVASLTYKGDAGSTSGLVIPRLCYPVDECAGEDLAVYSSRGTTVGLSIVGYILPPS